MKTQKNVFSASRIWFMRVVVSSCVFVHINGNASRTKYRNINQVEANFTSRDQTQSRMAFDCCGMFFFFFAELFFFFLAQSVLFFSFRLQCKFLVVFFLHFGDKLVLPTNREMLDWKSLWVCWNVNRPSIENRESFECFSLDWIQREFEPRWGGKVPRVHHHTSIRRKTQHIKRKEVNKQKYTQSVCEKHGRKAASSIQRKKCRVDLINYM